MKSRILPLAALSVVTGSIAGAEPSQIRLSFMDPAASSVGIAWTTASGAAGATVEYGTAPGSYNATAAATTTVVTGVGTVSEATLTGLQPATTYYYRVGGSGGWSAEHSFQTGPPDHPRCGTFRFVAVGDSRAQEASKAVSDVWPLLLQQVVTRKPAFVIHTGDIVQDGGEAKQWSIHLERTAPFSAGLPFNYALGNHDDHPGEGDGANYNKVFHLPRASKALGGSGTEDYYFFTYGNAIFIALSTQTFKGGTPQFQHQAAWLDAVLTQHPKRWKIVFLHHPIYTEYLFYNHPPDEQGQNAALVPVFNRHHIDLVFQGHNHFYERWAPSSCSAGGSATPCPVADVSKGTVYITTGGGGAFPHLLAGGANKTRPAAAAVHHYVLIDVADHTLRLSAIDGAGKTIDTFAISKATGTPDPCAGAGATSDGSAAATPGADAAGSPDRGAAPTPPGAASPGGGDGSCSCALSNPPDSADIAPALAGLLGLLLIRRKA